MKEKTWDNPNKMHIDTGHKTFDRQTSCIFKGNAITDTQFSSYIRSYNEAENPLGQPCEPGAMQEWDLNNWWNRSMPGEVRAKVKEVAIDHSVVLYRFSHHTPHGSIVHGFLLASHENQYIAHWVMGYNYRAKSQGVLAECARYVCDNHPFGKATP